MSVSNINYSSSQAPNAWNDFEGFFGIGGWTTANTDGMTADQAHSAADSATAKNVSGVMSIFNSINSAVGSYYAAKTQQYQLQSQASALQYQAGMDAINAHGAEMNAQSIEEQGKAQVEQYTMQAGQKAASTQVGTAARGIDLSSASAVDQRASDDLIKQINVLAINSNATREAWAQRTQATADSNNSLLASTSASNMLALSNTISPGLAETSSLLNSATRLASNWAYKSNQ